jgi:hypothetical protein
MKKILLTIGVLLTLATGCNTDDLILINPNSPAPDGTLATESGIKAFAAGILEKSFGFQNGLEGGNSAMFMALGHHMVMGDDIYIPWGNWGWRWSAIYTNIRTPDAVNHAHTLYPGMSQQEFMQANNSRAAGEVNSFKYEWIGAYWAIGQCNLLLDKLEEDIQFSGDGAVKKATLQAWAYWWKGYMYSRVGSMYLAGLIVDDFGQVNPEYVTRQEIIAEANENFDAAADILATLTADDSYVNVMQSIVMTFNNATDVVDPDMWIRAINTYKARNILVNTKVADMTNTEWNAIITLANNGVQEDDNIFTFGMTPDGNNDLSGGFYHPFWVANAAAGWWFVSERLIQEYDPADDRLANDFIFYPDEDDWQINVRNRGWGFGTRWEFVDIEEGGRFSTAAGVGQWPLSPTYEENQLMLAEAKIRIGTDIDGGLAHVDAVRDYQGAGLSDVSGTGLNQSQALEQFRRERRVALALRGLSFYDARRWGVTAPEADGGGRTGAMVIVPFSDYDPEDDGLPGIYPCYIEYNYMDYWDLPADEIDINAPLEGSPSVKN